MKRKYFIQLCCLIAITVSLDTCREKEESDWPAHIPGQPIKLSNFDPLEGGRATQLMIRAENLGNDPKILEVYFGDRKAPVIGCNMGKALVVVPRLPSTGEYDVIVKIGDNQVTYSEKFSYTVRAVVSTVCGNPNSGNISFREGPFETAVLRQPSYLTCDIYGNIFGAHRSDQGAASSQFAGVFMVNEEEQYVRSLTTVKGQPTMPTTDVTGRIIIVPENGGGDSNTRGDYYWEFDPEADWAAKERSVFHPTPEEIMSGVKTDFVLNTLKQSMAICPLDGKIYYRSNKDGVLIRFDSRTREGEWARTLEEVEMGLIEDEEGNIQTVYGHQPMYFFKGYDGDSFLVFDPDNPHMVYASYRASNNSDHIIIWLNILTGEEGIFAGQRGVDFRGWRDGPVEAAKFNMPRQMVLDMDGNLLIAEEGNHCIRKIDMKTRMVSTLVGIAGKRGYQDGNPDDALFDVPWGVCIDRRGEGTVYISDFGNRCIRKLTIE